MRRRRSCESWGGENSPGPSSPHGAQRNAGTGSRISQVLHPGYKDANAQVKEKDVFFNTAPSYLERRCLLLPRFWIVAAFWAA
jgi:hypothetical protein